jgi:hypothetical protein
MNTNGVSEEIDDIADGIQALGKAHPKHAKRLRTLCAQLDVVSNQLDSEEPEPEESEEPEEPKEKTPPRTSSRRRQAATPDIEDGLWLPESDYQDSYEAEDYHKAPVGNDSLSKAIDANLPDKVADLTFAQNTSGKDRHRILVQADRNGNRNGRRAAWPFGDLTPGTIRDWAMKGEWENIRRAASMALSTTNVRSPGRRDAATADPNWPEDETDSGRYGAEDNLTTADLAVSGDEDINKPSDADDEGGNLQFFGTYPQKAADDGPDSGHHRRNVPAPNRDRTSTRRRADRPVKPEVKQPDELLDDEPGDNVERDNPLGGLSGQYKGRKSGRSAVQEDRVYRPQHVPKELHGLWHRAAQRVASLGRLRLSSGEIDYYAIDDVYRDGLTYFRKQAAKRVNRSRKAGQISHLLTPSKVRVTRPDFVPRELTAYWNGAAQHLGNQNRLCVASRNPAYRGKIDYDGVNRQYIRYLDHVLNLPSE